MGIITSIYETTGAFSIHVKDTDRVILLRSGEVDSIVHIQETGEMWKEHLYCKIFTKHITDLQSASEALQIKALICFEFMDKHVFILNHSASKSIGNSEEYTLIPKELMTEIKGGVYSIEKQMINMM